MSVEFCGLRLAHPVINGSGTFDAIAAHRAFGEALQREFPFAAFVSKTITPRPRAGNPPPRLWEAPAGLINSIGLPNRGLDGYLAEDLPQLARLPGSAADHQRDGLDRGRDRAARAGVRRAAEIAAIELNVSCPNVRTGLDIGADPASWRTVVRAVRPGTGKPLIVKLTPNTADVAACARAAQDAGADAVSLINTLRAMALAPRTAVNPARPWLGGGTGGLSGPAIRTVALAQVAAAAAARGDSRDRHGRRAERGARAGSARRRGDARGGRDRELPRPAGGGADSARSRIAGRGLRAARGLAERPIERSTGPANR